ncbi:xeroderma pigmentosum group C-complementing protein [Mytilus galloprovincialis]|uniref:Xeroderma pigmentosum group C-complementing protein n=1 Tax=Mytilus galloprovincialis TaxID=29158 RepID=A0A8B6GJX1_MYTGA|nr:xeroderma pigmentosum group C-complementing protein [Mytilus galloprovincialis]
MPKRKEKRIQEKGEKNLIATVKSEVKKDQQENDNEGETVPKISKTRNRIRRNGNTSFEKPKDNLLKRRRKSEFENNESDTVMKDDLKRVEKENLTKKDHSKDVKTEQNERRKRKSSSQNVKAEDDEKSDGHSKGDFVDSDVQLDSYTVIKKMKLDSWPTAKLDPWPKMKLDAWPKRDNEIQSSVLSKKIDPLPQVQNNGRRNESLITDGKTKDKKACHGKERSSEKEESQSFDTTTGKKLKTDTGNKRKTSTKKEDILQNTVKAKKQKRQAAKSNQKHKDNNLDTTNLKDHNEPKTEKKANGASKKKSKSEPAETKQSKKVVLDKKSREKTLKSSKKKEIDSKLDDVDIMSDDSSDNENTQKSSKKIKRKVKEVDHRNDNKIENNTSNCQPLKSMSGVKKKVDMKDVTSVLLMMEGKTKVVDDAIPSTSGMQEESDESGDMIDSDESDWEEVAALHESPKKSQIPSGPIEITLDGPQIMKKRKKKTFDVKAYFQRLSNRFQKEVRENIHKVHFMCLLSRGMFLNRLCEDDTIKAFALSILPNQFTTVSRKAFNINLLARILIWYKEKFPFMTKNTMKELSVKERLEESFRFSTVMSYLERALVLIILLRNLGLITRLVMSIQPMPLKPKDTSKKSGKERNVRTEKVSEKNSKNSKTVPNKSAKTLSGKSSKGSKKKQSNESDSTESEYFKKKDKKPRSRSRGSKVKPQSYKGCESNDEDSSSESELDKPRRSKSGKQKNTGKGKVKEENTNECKTGSDDDFEEDSFTARSPVNLLKKFVEKNKNRKILSSDSDIEENTGCDVWTEVFLESEDKWLCIDCMNCRVNKPHVIESQVTKPLHYVLSFDNDGFIKDLTPKYASKWLTETRKLRMKDEWLQETLAPYKNPDIDVIAKEDNDIQARLVSQPVPKSVSELKSHPLYVLKRHLLKFEAIYPNSAIPVGYIKNEPIYARECLHVLHSRENWLKEGRAVRVGEEAYKMVKSRVRWKNKKENPDALDLEIFGRWQTEVYIPPPAVDGKVPRNGYGNIEIFMPSMIPAGTVHLKLPGLNKVAKKLDIDCVAAMTGWDTHCGFSHPLLDGFVVCEEYKDILIAAWDEDQEIQRQKEIEKREKRVIQNWRLLTKGLLIKEKLKRKYLLQPNLHEVETKEKTKTENKPAEKADDVEKAWPMNKEGSKSLSTAKHFKTETL